MIVVRQFDFIPEYMEYIGLGMVAGDKACIQWYTPIIAGLAEAQPYQNDQSI